MEGFEREHVIGHVGAHVLRLEVAAVAGHVEREAPPSVRVVARPVQFPRVLWRQFLDLCELVVCKPVFHIIFELKTEKHWKNLNGWVTKLRCNRQLNF